VRKLVGLTMMIHNSRVLRGLHGRAGDSDFPRPVQRLMQKQFIQRCRGTKDTF